MKARTWTNCSDTLFLGIYVPIWYFYLSDCMSFIPICSQIYFFVDMSPCYLESRQIKSLAPNKIILWPSWKQLEMNGLERETALNMRDKGIDFAETWFDKLKALCWIHIRMHSYVGWQASRDISPPSSVQTLGVPQGYQCEEKEKKSCYQDFCRRYVEMLI